ncbi:hypothetical protein D3093_33935 (plasmid) [Azospirillum argentinense]|uniref:Uncharacterized protein n=1 Tax=Azospirillum argentinense TaxID=2970906 RepID=A0A4D8PSF2_9PROT|nr:hypothetical protein D3093_33935 [Azospirillum argentinense]
MRQERSTRQAVELAPVVRDIWAAGVTTYAGLAGAEGLKTSVTDLLIAGKVELQHQGGAVGAEDRHELVSEAAGEPLRCETARRHG